jgi:hypothetical protein
MNGGEIKKYQNLPFQTKWSSWLLLAVQNPGYGAVTGAFLCRIDGAVL